MRIPACEESLNHNCLSVPQVQHLLTCALRLLWPFRFCMVKHRCAPAISIDTLLEARRCRQLIEVALCDVPAGPTPSSQYLKLISCYPTQKQEVAQSTQAAFQTHRHRIISPGAFCIWLGSQSDCLHGIESNPWVLQFVDAKLSPLPKAHV